MQMYYRSVTSYSKIRQVVSKNLSNLDTGLKVFMYSTQNNLDKSNGVKNKDRKLRGADPSS